MKLSADLSWEDDDYCWTPTRMAYLGNCVTPVMTSYLTVEPEFQQRPHELLPGPFLKYLRLGHNFSSVTNSMIFA
jgi:hypothetical protein